MFPDFKPYYKAILIKAGRYCKPGGSPTSGASHPAALARSNPLQGQCQMGSLTGAAHPANRTTGVLRRAQRGQKPPVEQKVKLT